MENKIIRADYSIKQYGKLITLSVIGFVLLLLPVKYNGNWTLTYGIICGKADVIVAPIIDYLVLAIFVASAVLGLITYFSKPKWITENQMLNNVFNVSPIYLLIRIIAVFVIISVQYSLGPEWVFSDWTGGTAYGLIKTITVWMFLGAFFIIFLMDSGIMDFIGTMITKIMRPLFTLPGRSTLDCLASWLGSGTTGVIITSIQYDEGYYTTREASVVATCFSTVSLSFTLVMAQVMKLEHLFFPAFLTITLVVVVSAMILPRIYPLRQKPDEYYPPVGKRITEEVPEGASRFKWAVAKAVEKSEELNSIGLFMKKGLNTVTNVWFDLCPMVMVIATGGLIIAEMTPIFQFISQPIAPVFEAIGIPESSAAASTMIVGFADQFIPIAMGAGITSEFTRFFVLCVAISQLIYMSEIGAILLRSNIDISLWNLVVVFFERTIIAIPIVLLVARFIIF